MLNNAVLKKRMLKKNLTLWACALMLAAVAVADNPVTQPAVDGHWEGSIAIPGRALEINVDFETVDGVLRGDISIPAQMIRDMELGDVALDGDQIHFKIPGVPGVPTFNGTVASGKITGPFTQAGAEFPFELVSGDNMAAKARAAMEGFGELAEKAIQDLNVPGTAIAVVAGGELVYAEGFGHRNIAEKLPMTPDSLFAIGSTTKAMTATVLGMLADEGKLDWDEPLVRYLPEFRLADDLVTARVTPRDLVTHQTGMPRHDMVWYNNNEGTRSDIIARLEHLELTAGLRERWQYNNLMYMTAGYLAGQLSGSTWEEVMQERLFGPLGMERSNMAVSDSDKDGDHARPYRVNDDQELEEIPFRVIDLVGPAGSVNSSVREMSRWLLFNLAGGEVDGQQLIQENTLKDIHATHAVTGRAAARPDIHPMGYGLGWLIDSYRGHLRISHGGGIDGFITAVTFFPNDDLGIVAFTNVGSGLPPLLTQHAADRILGLEPVDWVGEAVEARKKALEEAEKEDEDKDIRVAGTQPSHPLEAYVGEYEDGGYGVVTVRAEGDALAMEINDIHSNLEHWHYNVWNATGSEEDPTLEGQKILFRYNLDGDIDALEAVVEPAAGPVVFEKRAEDKLNDPEYLERYAGVYKAEVGLQVTVAVVASRLTATIPGQPTYTLEPQVSGRFVLEEFRVASVEFVEENGNVVGLIVRQPGAVVEAQRVGESETGD